MHWCCRHKKLQNNANDISPESCYVKDYEKAKLVNLPSCYATQLLLLLHMIFENNDFGVGGNVNFFTEANFILMNAKITTLKQKIIF